MELRRDSDQPSLIKLITTTFFFQDEIHLGVHKSVIFKKHFYVHRIELELHLSNAL